MTIKSGLWVKARVWLALLLLLLVGSAPIHSQQTIPLTGTTRATTELLTNGGFETDSDSNKIPDGWTGKKIELTKPDRQKCDNPAKEKFLAHSGSCAFVLQGNPAGTSSTLQQSLTNTSALISGRQVIFSAYLDPRSGVQGAVFGKAQIQYEHPFYTQKFKLIIPEVAPLAAKARNVEDYVQVEATDFIFIPDDQQTTRVKVKFVQAASSGKFLIDDVSFRTTALRRLLASENSSVYFGDALAISSDGNTALIGADFESGGANFGVGAAYVFSRDGESWVEQARLTADDGEAEDYFGIAVALSSDGNTALIGGSGKNDVQGVAYIFTRSSGTWTQQQKLNASDGGTNDTFGDTVALSSDGSTALIGAPKHTVENTIEQGQVYIYTGVNWSEETAIILPEGAVTDHFGDALALSSDDTTLVIGATNVDADQGAAYVYTGGGADWTFQAKLSAGDGAQDYYFGNAIALSSDGNTALIGDELHDLPSDDYQGAAYVFTRSGTIWTQQQKSTSGEDSPQDFFGHAVALSSDGNTALVGAFYQLIGTTINQGAAYAFTRNAGVWSQPTQLLGINGEPDDQVSAAVMLTDNGATAFIGSPGDDIANSSDRGSVYVFDLTQP